MASRETRRLNPRGIRLRRSFEHRALMRMLDQIEDSQNPLETICKLMHSYCELLRQDAAQEKSSAGPRRPATRKSAPASGTSPEADNTAMLVQAVRDLYGIDLDKAEGVAGAGDAAKGESTAGSRSHPTQN